MLKKIYTGLNNITKQSYFIVYQLLLAKKKPCLIVYEDKKIAQKLSILFGLWVRFFKFKKRKVVFFDANNKDFVTNLVNFKEGIANIYFLEKEYFFQFKSLVANISSYSYIIKQESVASINTVKNDLIKLGYDFNTTGEEFTFYSRGNFLHIYTNNEHIRLEFDDIRIIKIIVFNEQNKTKEEFLEYIFYPTSLNDLDSDIKTSDNSLCFKDILTFTLENFELEGIDLDIISLYHLGANGEKIDYKALKSFHKKYNDFFLSLEDYLGLNYKINILVQDKTIIKNLFNTYNKKYLERINLYADNSAYLLDGFVDSENKIVFFTHKTIFGSVKHEIKKIKKWIKRSKKAQIEFLTSLKKGDFIVHEDHGVGRFIDIIPIKVGEYERESLVIEYEQGDKLYVPVELLHKVDKYIGQARPKLYSLGGTTWNYIKLKVKEESKRFAKDLLNIYAQRELVELNPWQTEYSEYNEFIDNFPYKATICQEKVMSEIIKDLGLRRPMDRLVVGDVGFGKTEIAMRAALLAVLNKKQVAILCPTTVLAEQHGKNFINRFKGTDIKIEVLNRFTKKLSGTKKEKDIVNKITSGEIDIIIGTHRLLSKDIKFNKLGLVIIDEEQRFGVKHKETLKLLKISAHTLTLTATPIPRTLYLSLSGLRDISTILTPPSGRKTIDTIIREYDEKVVNKAILDELQRGGQVYYLYNRVASIETMAIKLKKMTGLSRARIGIAHGQLPSDELLKVMNDFKHGLIDILLCSTIVENGLDLPNVNTLIVHNSIQFGLGQLYQIRGRIGRGLVKAKAYFFYQKKKLTGVAQSRLIALEEAKELGSGFQLAMRDLEIRGIGNIIGKNQHGHVMTVGLNLYLKLLAQTVKQLEQDMTGEIIKSDDIDVKITLPLNYKLPLEVFSQSERILTYRRLASIDDYEELLHEKERILSKYRNIKESIIKQLDNLIYLFRVKLACKKTKISAIDYSVVKNELRGSKKVFSIVLDNFYDIYTQRKLKEYNENFYIKENVAKINIDKLENWQDDILKIIKLLKI